MSYLKQLIELIEKYGLYNVPGLGPTIAKIQLGRMSEAEARRCLIGLAPIIKERMLRPNVIEFLPEAEDLNADGPVEVVLGRTENNLPFGLSPSRGVVDVLIAGCIGAGKTVLKRRLTIGLRKLRRRLGIDITLAVIDLKGDFLDLPQICEGPWIVVDGLTTLRSGLQPPDGVHPDTWIAVICTSLAARTNMIASRVGLSRIVRWLVQAMNTATGTTDLWPNWHLVLAVMDASPWQMWYEKPEYHATARQVLLDACDNSGPMLDCFRGLDVSACVRDHLNVVVALDRIALPWLRAWCIDLFASQLLFSRLGQLAKTDSTVAVLCVDEADDVVSLEQDRVFPLQLSPLGRFIKQGREFGLMGVFSVSVLSNVSPLIAANCSDLFICRLYPSVA